MDQNLVALISGLVGAVIGSLTSMGTLIIQNAFQNRREAKKLLFETAFKDYELRFRYEAEGTPRRAAFPVILAYHERMIELIEKGTLTPAAARNILDAQVEMGEALAKAVERTQAKPAPKGNARARRQR
jgi:hypothetical protein